MSGEDFSRYANDDNPNKGRNDLEARTAQPPESGRGNSLHSASPVPTSRPLLFLLASFWAGLAGIIAWWVGESKILEAATNRVQFVVAGRSIVWSTPATTEAAARVTSCVLHAVFGGLLGLFMGGVGGWARSSTAAALRAGLIGAGLGALLGAGTPYLVLPVYSRYRELHGGDLTASLVLHISLWAGLGAAAGLALGLGVGGSLRALKAAGGGFLGALCGALIFDLVGAVAFPLEEAGLPTSATARTRLLARVLVGVMTAVGATIAAGPTPVRMAKPDRV